MLLLFGYYLLCQYFLYRYSLGFEPLVSFILKNISFKTPVVAQILVYACIYLYPARTTEYVVVIYYINIFYTGILVVLNLFYLSF